MSWHSQASSSLRCVCKFVWYWEKLSTAHISSYFLSICIGWDDLQSWGNYEIIDKCWSSFRRGELWGRNSSENLLITWDLFSFKMYHKITFFVTEQLEQYIKRLEIKSTTLKCLASRVIAQHKINYRSHVPVHLEKFIQLHSANKTTTLTW